MKKELSQAVSEVEAALLERKRRRLLEQVDAMQSAGSRRDRSTSPVDPLTVLGNTTNYLNAEKIKIGARSYLYSVPSVG